MTEIDAAYPVNTLTGAPLFTPDQLAAQLGLDISVIDPNIAAQLGQLASDAVREELRLTIDYVANDTVTLWGDNGEILMLPERPVTAVSSVILAGIPLVPIQMGTGSTLQMYDWRPEGTLRRAVYGGSFYAGALYFKWPYGVPVNITYTHGWAVVPPAFVQVALELAVAAYSNPELHKLDRSGWVESQTDRIGLSLTPIQMSRLDRYRRLTF